jgi:[ribosomal protein S5]-alanine N-acetyltransferase
MRLLRALEAGDARPILELRLANREHVAWTEPDFPDGDVRYTLAGVEAWLARDHGHAFGIETDGELVGTISIFGISGPPFSSGMIGYFVAVGHEGKGLASAAVEEIVAFAFGELRLHRVEAGTRVDNVGSQRVLEKNGFTRVGVRRKHLLIGGRWVDHVLWERLEDD